MKLLCITGMPCAGKTTTIKILSSKFPVVSMGDIIRKKMDEKNIHKDMREYSADLRKEDKGCVAKLCIPEIEKFAKISDICIIDGVRNYEEIVEFKKFYDVILLAVHASPKKRYERFIKRKRPDDNLTYEGFIARDIAELNWGLGSVIALSDLIIQNEGDDIEKFKENLITLLRNNFQDFFNL